MTAFPPGLTLETTDGDVAADLEVPAGAAAAIVIAGDGRTSPADRYVAFALQAAGLATLQLDLGPGDLDRQATRIVDAIRCVRRRLGVTVGLYAAGAGVAPALIAARVERGLGAIVVRGERAELSTIATPVLVVDAGPAPDALDRAARRARAFLARALGATATGDALWIG